MVEEFLHQSLGQRLLGLQSECRRQLLGFQLGRHQLLAVGQYLVFPVGFPFLLIELELVLFPIGCLDCLLFVVSQKLLDHLLLVLR